MQSESLLFEKIFTLELVKLSLFKFSKNEGGKPCPTCLKPTFVPISSAYPKIRFQVPLDLSLVSAILHIAQTDKFSHSSEKKGSWST